MLQGAKETLLADAPKDELGPFFRGVQRQFYDLIAALLVHLGQVLIASQTPTSVCNSTRSALAMAGLPFPPELLHLLPVAELAIDHERPHGLDELPVAEDVDERPGRQRLQTVERGPGSMEQRAEALRTLAVANSGSA